MRISDWSSDVCSSDLFVIEIVALTRALTDAGEHRGAAVALGDIVDQFLDQHGLADAGAAEQADLAALGVGREQIDDLDAGDEDRAVGRLDRKRGVLGKSVSVGLALGGGRYIKKQRIAQIK